MIIPEPSHSEPEYFDPLSTRDLTIIICERFERVKLQPLSDELARFEGSGLYAIYCTAPGSDLYEPLISPEIPVYVGKSHSNNSAIGKPTRDREPLWERIRKHQASIAQAENLSTLQFGVRVLRMPDVHCDLGENGLRVGYRPVWNSVLTGFGSNDQGGNRTSARSQWDAVHPGRKRTFGKDPHDTATLRAKAIKHVSEQVTEFRTLRQRLQ